MDFNDSPEEARWRAQVRDWLDRNGPAPKSADDGETSIFDEQGGDSDFIDAAKRWQATKFDAGYAAITWPREYGGVDGTVMQQIIFNQEENRYDAPTGPFVIGIGMIAPTIRACGTDRQRDRYLTKLLRGDEIWCQMFSEPSAGSDVASLGTMARRDGDEFVINGQKVWTSGAQFSDFGEIICRTDPDAPKHRGITAFIVDMATPGISVLPLRQMTGGASFNEVFFDDVRVPVDNVIGDIDSGWSVAITTLMNERVAIGSSSGAGGGITKLIELARRHGATDDPITRQHIAELYSLQRLQKFNSMRTLSAISKGVAPGPQGSVGKLLSSKSVTRLGELALEIIGPAGVADRGGDATRDFMWSQIALGAPGMHIAGGSDEVLKNVIGERVLGLPGEPRVDKVAPWKELVGSS